jgi:hypothetical protein
MSARLAEREVGFLQTLVVSQLTGGGINPGRDQG